MKIVVWGTGNLYKRYRSFLSQFEIVRFCDNNPEKQGTYINGVEVIKPSGLEEFEFTYVVVMAYKTEDICFQIRELGIPDEMVIVESQLCSLRQVPICVHAADTRISLDRWIMENENRILLISHNYSYTGIPVALKNMACVLKKMGYTVLMAAMEGGTFVQELNQQEIAYIDDLAICYRSRCFLEALDKFQVIIIGSFALYELAMAMEKIKRPILWWIHETAEKYYTGKENLTVNNNVKFMAGGNRVKKVFIKYYPTIKIEKIQYCIPDLYENMIQEDARQNRSNDMTIAVIGTIDRRKAQDILLEAIIQMPVEKRNRLKIFLIGRMDENDIAFAKRIEEQRKQLDNLEWIEEMSQEALEAFYERIEVLVCPSRDDPMPIVVTQAMMHGRVCVISDEVGQAEFIKQQENGFVFSNENTELLMQVLLWLLEHKSERVRIGKQSRKIYENEFSEKVMEKQLEIILGDICV